VASAPTFGIDKRPRKNFSGAFYRAGADSGGGVLLLAAAAPAFRIEIAPRLIHIAAQLAPLFLRHLPAASCGGVIGRKLGRARRRCHALRPAAVAGPALLMLRPLPHALPAGTVTLIGRAMLSLRRSIERQQQHGHHQSRRLRHPRHQAFCLHIRSLQFHQRRIL
jgi:hypothetical protein